MKRIELDFDEILAEMEDNVASTEVLDAEWVLQWIEVLREWKEAHDKGDCR